MDPSSQNLLSDREKGERLKEIFETLNKMKKRIERLKTTRSLTPAEMKEYTDISIKLSSFYEKCKNFIKTRKNGPGKFMIEEYLKWCSSQKSAQHRSSNQYRSSLEYIKDTYGQERMCSDPNAAKAWHSFSPSQPHEGSGPSPHFRGACPVYHGKHPLAQGYSAGMKHLGKTGGSSRSRAESTFFSPFVGARNIGSSPIPLRAGLGHIEPLHCPRESAGGLQNVYQYTSSKCSARPQSTAPQPVTVAAKRASHPKAPSMLEELDAESLRALKSTNAQSTCRPGLYQFDRGNGLGKKSVANAGRPPGTEIGPGPKCSNVLTSPFAKNVILSDTDPSRPFGSGIQNGHATNPFPRLPRFAYPDDAHLHTPHHAGNPLSVLQSPMQFSNPLGHTLQHEQHSTLPRDALGFSLAPKSRKTVGLRSHSVGAREPSPKCTAARLSRNVCEVCTTGTSHDFSFEFRFENRADAEYIPSFNRTPGILKDEECVPASSKPSFIAKASAKSISPIHDQKIMPKSSLSGLKRASMEDFIREIDPESYISAELRDCILIHLDSVMHRAAMISATIASTRPDRSVHIDDVCLGLRKAVRPEFVSCFKSQRQIDDDRDYSLHNRILENIENQKQ